MYFNEWVPYGRGLRMSKIKCPPLSMYATGGFYIYIYLYE